MNNSDLQRSHPSWRFAATDGGLEQGARDAGLATFADDAVSKTVREILQNSLDHQESGLPTVHVDFSLVNLPRDLIAADELILHVNSCINEMMHQGDRDAQLRFERARELLSLPTIPCLSITDSSTTGLKGKNWRDLIFIEGAGRVGSQGEGGSYGFGKLAPFNLSALSTIFYSTRYLDSAAKGRVMRMVGKARITTHFAPDDTGTRLQHTGFYGNHLAGVNHPVEGRDTPDEFILDEPGTRVLIAGFDWQRLCPNWFDEVIQSAAKNFFYAIHHQNLSVSVNRESAPYGEPAAFTLNNHTLEMALEKLSPRDPARWYYQCIREETPQMTTPSNRLGEMGAIYLWVSTADKAPRRTAHMNRKGMFITDARRFGENPFYPSGGASWPAYWCAVSMAANDDADAYIRRMEPLAHNAVTYRLLPSQDERDAARLEFELQREQIGQIIRNRIDAGLKDNSTNIEELAELFPDVPDMDSDKSVELAWVKKRERTNTELRVPATPVQNDDDYVDDVPPVNENDDEDKNEEDREENGNDDDKENKRDRENQNKDRDDDGISNTQVRASRVLRSSAREIVLSLSVPEEAAAAGVRFAICPAGEQYVDFSERLPVVAVRSNALLSSSVDDGIVTLEGISGKITRVYLTLDGEVSYTGYSVVTVPS